jgi:catechol 2,3-dioxygenase-like lactoylglutathione lyase family enzyme
MGHVHLNVADPAAHQRLWIEHFDAVAVEHQGIPGIRLPQLLLLFRQQAPAGGSLGSTLEHFGLKVRSTPQVVERWRAAGLTVEAEFTGAEGFPNAYLLFPDAMRLEIQQDESLDVIAQGHHLHYFIAGDYLPLRQWYADTFGAVLSKRGRIDTADLPERMNFSFTTPTRPGERVGSKGRVIDHIAFEVRDLEAFCGRLAANGVQFDAPYGRSPEHRVASAVLTDPAGVVIELTEGLGL